MTQPSQLRRTLATVAVENLRATTALCLQTVKAPSLLVAAALCLQAATALACAPALVSDDPELILTGGVVYPLGPSDRAVRAIAIRGDRVLAVGDDEEIRALAGEATQQMELDGAVVLPGFRDAWIDPEALGRWEATELDLRLTSTLEEVQAMVRNAAGALPPSSWLIGWGWDENRWPEPRLPSREQLDAAVGDRPVVLYHRTGDLAWLNSAAVATVDLEGDAPPGGRVLRRDDGTPSGVLVGNALAKLEDALPPVTADQRREWILAGLQRAAASGLTTVFTAPVDRVAAEQYALLVRQELMPLRVELRLEPDAVSVAPPSGSSGGLLNVRAVGVRLDGAVPARLAAVDKPYADDPGRGLLLNGAQPLAGAAQAARAAGLPLDLQFHGDRAATLALAQLGEPNTMLVGLDLLPSGGLEPIRAANCAVAIVPLRFANDVYWLDQRLGSDATGRVHRWREIAAAGIPLLTASDAPAYPLRPLAGLATTTTRSDIDGYPAGGWHPEEKLGRSVALRALVGPEASGAEPVLAPGAAADLVVWSEDPLAGPPEALLRAEALLTIVAGRVAFTRPLMGLPMTAEPDGE